MFNRKKQFNPKIVKENKEHYKLYKAGKFIQTAMLTVLVAGSLSSPVIQLMSAKTASADMIQTRGTAPTADYDAAPTYSSGFLTFGMRAGISQQPQGLTIKKGSSFNLQTSWSKTLALGSASGSFADKVVWYRWDASNGKWVAATGTSTVTKSNNTWIWPLTNYQTSTSTYTDSESEVGTQYYYADYYTSHLLASDDHYASNVVSVNVVESDFDAESLDISGSSYMLRNSTQQLEKTVNPGDSTATYTWSSSNESVVKVDEYGNVTSQSINGTATITLTANNPLGASISTTFDINVGTGLEDVYVDAGEDAVFKMQGVDITDGVTITYNWYDADTKQLVGTDSTYVVNKVTEEDDGRRFYLVYTVVDADGNSNTAQTDTASLFVDTSASESESISTSQSISESEANSTSTSEKDSLYNSQSESLSVSDSASESESASTSEVESTSESTSSSESESTSVSESASESTSVSTSESLASESESTSVSESASESTSASTSESL
ncbi:hypothetical protein ESZ50_09140, partial [Weissella muntiaci]